MAVQELIAFMRKPRFFLVVPYNSSIIGFLARDPEVLVGIVNSGEAIRAPERLLFIEYSSLRDKIKGELSVYRFSTLSTIYIYLALMASISAYVYYEKWVRVRALYRKLLDSIGASPNTIVVQEAKGLVFSLLLLSALVIVFDYVNILRSVEERLLVSALALFLSILVALVWASSRRGVRAS
jgi:hypothetical protein